MGKNLRAAFGLFALLFLLTGLVYPAAVLGIGQTLFPWRAGGSLIEDNGRVIGAALIGQDFTGPAYFHPRPSYAGQGYDAAHSSGSNLAPSSADLSSAVAARVAALRAGNGGMEPVPADLVTASSSGLDPDISVASARFEAPRVAKARHMALPDLLKLIDAQTEPPTLGVLGENRINVLEINRTLGAVAPPESPSKP